MIIFGESENDFIWELIDSPEQKLNLPILVCEEDCDLSCIMILVQLRKTEEYICWDKIGVLNRDNWDKDKEMRSGILCLESYTDEDWERYGDNIATERYNSREYWDWVSENWYEENIRRLRNYMKPYLQTDANIEWMKTVNWQFNRAEYMEMVEEYRTLYHSDFRLYLRAYKDFDAEHIVGWIKDEISFRKWCADRYGKEMLSLALRYAFDYFEAEKVALGVFENNESAYYCYKSVGFQEVLMDKTEVFSILGEEWKCLEMEVERYWILQKN